MKKILLASLLLCCALPLLAGETGCVYGVKGPAEIMRDGSGEWRPALKGSPLAEGDRIKTGSGSCEILFKDGTFIKMEKESETAIETLRATKEERFFSFSFLRGKALWMAARIKGKTASRFSVRTPSAVCAVRGTDFSVIVSSDGESTVGLFEGKVAVSGRSAEEELLSGQELSSYPGGLKVRERLSRLMKAEERRYAKVKGRVESLRKRLAEREAFIDDYINRQRKTIEDFDARRKARLNK